MAMSHGRFDNVFKRLDVELDRMRRIPGLPDMLIDDFREKLLKYRPKDEATVAPPAVRGGPTTPYQVAFNRLEAFTRNEMTWDYFLKSWDECNPDDQAALNELINYVKGE